MRFLFRKLHGLGNDFVVVDCRTNSTLADALSEPAIAKAICHRSRGIGADGILPILAASRGALAKMLVINSDGSQAEMCGNGIRCVAKVLGDGDPSLKNESTVTLETAAGFHRCELRRHGGLVTDVSVEMGAPALDRKSVPMIGDGQFVDQPLEIAGQTFRFTAVSMGNPHLVTFDAAADDLRRLALSLGPALENHPLMPNRTNVEFATLRDDGSVEVWVWERGSGLTQACGTGACATLVAAIATGRASFDTPATVHLPGGPLEIKVLADYEGVWMRGPAEAVFSGQWNS